MKESMLKSLRTLKTAWWRARFLLNAILYRMRGVSVGRRCELSGASRFFMKRGSRIVLEDEVALHSDPACNHLISRPCFLSCIAPGAEIIMRRGSGMSSGTIVCSTRVEVGEYTMIGAGCTIYDSKEHEYRPECGWKFPPDMNEGKPIHIGKRCYIGMNCVILKGVTIGDNCVISAGSVIAHDVPAGHMARGNPAVCTPLSARLRTTPDGVVAVLTEC